MDNVVARTTAAVDDAGLGVLLSAGRVARVTASYVGENKEFARQYLAGELEVELCPQGTLAERLRAGGAGIPAFHTPAGVGTLIADGGLPWRYDAHGGVSAASPAKKRRDLLGRSSFPWPVDTHAGQLQTDIDIKVNHRELDHGRVRSHR